MSEIRRTGSLDQILGYDPYCYDPSPLDMEQIREEERDEREQEWWCGVEPPAEDLIEVMERAS